MKCKYSFSDIVVDLRGPAPNTIQMHSFYTIGLDMPFFGGRSWGLSDSRKASDYIDIARHSQKPCYSGRPWHISSLAPNFAMLVFGTTLYRD